MKKIAGILACLVLLSWLPAAGALTGGDFGYELEADGTALLTRYLGTQAAPVIPDTLDGHPVTQIGDNAFRDSGFLEKVTIPEGVKILGAQAFYNCAALKEVNLPLSLKEVGDLAFAYCAALRDIKVPEGTQKIGEFAFGDCSALHAAVIPGSVTLIGPDAFLGTAAGFGIFGPKESYAQEYALSNGISFTPLGEGSPDAQTGPDGLADELPPPAADDLPLEATPGPAVTAEITVRFPHADRTGTYTGEMRDGLAHGKGSFSTVNDEGVVWTYRGEWENGAMNGLGTLTWSDGLSYEGYYRENQPYSGKWLIDGAAIYTGGFRMCPECGRSVFHGQGTLTNRLGRVIYEGGFDDGLLMETAQGRQARAQALDPNCETLLDEGYTTLMNTQGAGAGTLFRLEGRVGEILTDDAHGEGAFLLLNNGSAASPLHISYRYAAGEERAQTGRQATVWGTVIKLYRDTDSRGRARVMLQMDADVIRLGEEPAQRGLSEVVITAAKVLEGRLLKNREFTFALDETFSVLEERINPLDGTVTFIPVTYTTRLQTRGNSRDGNVAFDPIRYAPEDIGGVFTYTVTEIPGLEEGMFYDPMAMTVMVIVSDNGGGRPAASVFYPDDTFFNNAVQPEQTAAQHVFEAFVDLSGRPLDAGEFTFQLLEGGVVLQDKTNDATGRITFEPIGYTAADIGTTRNYTIRQVPGNLPGMAYDLMEIPFTLTAEFDPGGIGLPMLTISMPEDTTFNNAFSARAEVEIVFSVALEGRAIKNGEFSFELSETGNVLQKKRSGRDGGVYFDPIVYTQADAGQTFSYAVMQVPGNEPGIEYDTAVKGVEVTVRLEGGLLTTGAVYTAGTDFVNRFTQQVTVPVLSRVDADKTSVTAGEAVTFTPIVSGGTKPYSYHYILYRDGKLINDIGWVDNAIRRSQLGNPGVVQMQVEVKDAEGRLTQALMSPEVTVRKPAWTPMDLSGRWNLSLVITGSTGEADTPVGTVFPMQIDVQMKDSTTGTANYYFEKFSGTPGTLNYSNGTVTVVITNEWNEDTLKGNVEFKDGAVTMSGTYFESSPKRNLTYSGTWTAEKEE